LSVIFFYFLALQDTILNPSFTMGQTLSSLIHVEQINVNISGGSEKWSVKIAKADLMLMIDSSFVFPKEKSVIAKEVTEAHIQLSYACNDGNCNFSNALASIKTSNEAAELKGLGVQQLTKVIVDTIDQYPDVFPSQGLGGYIFQSTGRSYLLLKNETPPPSDVRYGFVDLTKIRKQLIFHSIRKHEQDQDWIWKAISAFSIATTLTLGMRFRRVAK
jgi:hypothetical protein